MKKSELTEVKKADIKPLLERASKERAEIAGLFLDKSVQKLKNLRQIKAKRRDLAQILTILRQKELVKILEEKNVKK